MISESCGEILEQRFSGIPNEIFQRMKRQPGRKGIKYTKELKSFAMTLQYYSAKAYNFVRKSLNLALPHPSVIRRWYTRLPAEPGFTSIAFAAIKEKVRTAHNPLVCSLMLDEMAIRKHIQFDGKKFRGFVDLGTDYADDDSAPQAKDVLVFMAVCVNGSWKIPLGYFFIAGLNGSERANLVRLCVKSLSETGITVASLTCDGPSCHFAMLSSLGANLSTGNMVPSFPNPHNPANRIFVLLDACHMLKLVRNCIAEWGTLYDGDGGRISWDYVVNLAKLQSQEGLRLGNKLKNAHINWQQQKMKVALAAQTISSSVADAIDYCNKELKISEFKDSEATVAFLKNFDRIFDILNSRNPFGKGYKAPLKMSNQHLWQPFLADMKNYISNLKDSSGRYVLQSRRKTGFLGFLICIASTESLFESLVSSQLVKYLLMYKFSQDHLELFFCAVRGAGGFNNNPTCLQFTAAYKRLLLKLGIRISAGNCQQRDETSILDLMDHHRMLNDGVTLTDANLIRKYSLDEPRPAQCDHDYVHIPQDISLSEYKEQVVHYIAGYVSKSLKDKLRCIECKQKLCSPVTGTNSLLEFKNRGGLTRPSFSVVKICLEAEKCFQRMLRVTSGKLPHCRGMTSAVSTAVLKNVSIMPFFSDFNDHIHEAAVEDNHAVYLTKSISKTYCKIRFKHLGSEFNEMPPGDRIRQVLSKLILFQHQ